MMASGRNTELCALLLDYGADIDAVDNRNETALYVAAQKGHQDTVKLLHERGADLNIEDNKGRSAFSAACLSGYLDVCNYLLLV